MKVEVLKNLVNEFEGLQQQIDADLLGYGINNELIVYHILYAFGGVDLNIKLK